MRSFPRVVLFLLAFVLARAACAHDIPTDVRLLAFVRPQGQQLTLLVRLPMAALREVDVPLRPGGFIDLARADGALREAATLWLLNNLDLYEEDRRLPPATLARLRISLPADRSFQTWDAALAHLSAPPIASTEQLYWNQQLLDVELQVPIASEQARFSVEPRFARLGLRVALALRYLPPGGPERAYELHGDPGLVHLDPRWHQAAWRFVQSGFMHILEGADHLLFLFCLVLPVRRAGVLLGMATAFTLAHSLTLAATALGFGPQGLWFPPFVETLIAASIVWMALANVLGGGTRHRWQAAFGFGLVHGFGFAFALREQLQFAGSHVAGALLAFNVGVEGGQIAALAVMLPAVMLLLHALPERPAVIVASAWAAHTAWHWMAERGQAWWQHPLPRPDAADLSQLLAWLTAGLAGLLLARALRGRRMRR